MLKAMAIGFAILLPFAVIGTVLVNVLDASRPVALGFLLAMGAAAGIVGPLVDFKLNPEASKRRKDRGGPGLSAS